MPSVCSRCRKYIPCKRKNGKRCLWGYSIHWQFCKYLDPIGLVLTVKR